MTVSNPLAFANIDEQAGSDDPSFTLAEINVSLYFTPYPFFFQYFYENHVLFLLPFVELICTVPHKPFYTHRSTSHRAHTNTVLHGLVPHATFHIF